MKPLYIEAPNYHNPGDLNDKQNTIFLAGSITNAANWQNTTAQTLLDAGFTVFNPRRDNYNNQELNIEHNQISWEHYYLNLAGNYLFYFAPETLAPITLFEYGTILTELKYTPWKKVYVAIHPEYKRKNDVIIQTELRKPELIKNIKFNLEETIKQIINEN